MATKKIQPVQPETADKTKAEADGKGIDRVSSRKNHRVNQRTNHRAGK